MSARVPDQAVVQTIRSMEELQAGCPMAALLASLTRPWTLHILWLLSRNGPMRFGALRRSVEGISARLLTVRLRSLEKEGFVQRELLIHGNVREVTYRPTTRTQEMNEVMGLLGQLSRRWVEEDLSKVDTSPRREEASRRV